MTGQVRYITVAADGTGEFASVQEAVNSIRAYMSDTTYMFIEAGIYREKIVIPSWVTNLFMKGEGAEKTIIKWDDYAGLRDMGTFRTYTIWIQGSGFTAEDITFENSAGPLRGRKRSLYEGGVRVPAFVHWPARIPTGRATEVPCVSSDYLPTVLDVVGFERRGAPQPLDGVSLAPLIEGRMTERPAPIGFQSGKMATWNDNRYKLVVGGGDTRPELYDLIADPVESSDLATEHPDIVERMLGDLRKWQQSCTDSAAGRDY